MYGYTCSTYHELWKQICDFLVCRRFGLSTFWSVDLLVYRHFGLLTFPFVDVLVCDVLVCRRFGLSTFRIVDVLVYQSFGCRRFGFSKFWPVTGSRINMHRTFPSKIWNIKHHKATLTSCAVYPKKYAHYFVVLCFVVVMQSFIMNSREVFIHIHQGCSAGTGAIVRLPQCQWSKPDGYGKISQCITTTKHSKAKTVCIFLYFFFTKWCPMGVNIKPPTAQRYENIFWWIVIRLCVTRPNVHTKLFLVML